MIQLPSPLPQPQLLTHHPSPPSKSSLWIIIVNVDKLKPFVGSIFKKGEHQLFHAFSLLQQRSTKHVGMQYIQNRVDYIKKVLKFVYQSKLPSQYLYIAQKKTTQTPKSKMDSIEAGKLSQGLQ